MGEPTTGPALLLAGSRPEGFLWREGLVPLGERSDTDDAIDLALGLELSFPAPPACTVEPPSSCGDGTSFFDGRLLGRFQVVLDFEDEPSARLWGFFLLEGGRFEADHLQVDGSWRCRRSPTVCATIPAAGNLRGCLALGPTGAGC